MAEEVREFENTFNDYNGEVLFDEATKELRSEYKTKLNAAVEHLMAKLDQGVKHEIDWYESSVYTGTTGIALLYLLLHDRLGTDRYLGKAMEFFDISLKKLKGRRQSFMCGDSGPLAVAAVLYQQQGLKKESEACIKKIENMLDSVLNLNTDLPDELLYGRVGYLFALLYLRKHLGENTISSTIVEQVCQAVLMSGKKLSQRLHSACPLMYAWHEKQYLGAAHGLAGIYYMLMQVTEPKVKNDIERLVKPCVDYMMSLRYTSGNYPSSMGNKSDKLVHWCHGASGFIHTFCLAYRRFGDEKYLHAALECGNVIWQRGLLKKGYGICHGVAGNAYAFLNLFQLTKDQKHLYRAWKFAEWCFDYGKHGCRIADHPFSLFEGLAGTIYFLCDLQHPLLAAFPAFDLSH